MNLNLTTATSGLISAVIAEIFKLFPLLRANSLVSSIVAIIVVAVVSFLASGEQFNLANVLGTLTFAFVSYSVFVQPVAKAVGSTSQNQ